MEPPGHVYPPTPTIPWNTPSVPYSRMFPCYRLKADIVPAYTGGLDAHWRVLVANYQHSESGAHYWVLIPRSLPLAQVYQHLQWRPWRQRQRHPTYVLPVGTHEPLMVYRAASVAVDYDGGDVAASQAAQATLCRAMVHEYGSHHGGTVVIYGSPAKPANWHAVFGRVRFEGLVPGTLGAAYRTWMHTRLLRCLQTASFKHDPGAAALQKHMDPLPASTFLRVMYAPKHCKGERGTRPMTELRGWSQGDELPYLAPGHLWARSLVCYRPPDGDVVDALRGGGGNHNNTALVRSVPSSSNASLRGSVTLQEPGTMRFVTVKWRDVVASFPRAVQLACGMPTVPTLFRPAAGLGPCWSHVVRALPQLGDRSCPVCRRPGPDHRNNRRYLLVNVNNRQRFRWARMKGKNEACSKHFLEVDLNDALFQATVQERLGL